MKKTYQNALGMMVQGDEGLSLKIMEFISEFPPSLVEKIESRRKSGFVIKDNKRWMFEDSGSELSISVGKDDASCKDIMSLFIASISDDRLKQWPRFEGEKLIGSIAFYLYDSENRKAKPLRATYDFYVKRIDKNVVMTITTNVNAAFEDNAKKLERYGLSEIHKKVIGSYYKLDTESILKSDNR